MAHSRVAWAEHRAKAWSGPRHTLQSISGILLGSGMAGAAGPSAEMLQYRRGLAAPVHPSCPDTWPPYQDKVLLLRQGKVDITNHQKYVGRTEKTRGDVTRSVAQILRPRRMMTTYSGFLSDTDH